MNRLERNFGATGEAHLKYLPGEFKVLVAGSYVICAVTGARIPLEDLRYWSAEHQEAYATPDAALERYRQRS